MSKRSRSSGSLNKAGTSGRSSTGWRRPSCKAELREAMNYHRTQFSATQGKNNEGLNRNKSEYGYTPSNLYSPSSDTLLGSGRYFRRGPHFYSSRYMTPLPPIGSANSSQDTGRDSLYDGAPSNHRMDSSHSFFQMLKNLRQNRKCI